MKTIRLLLLAAVALAATAFLAPLALHAQDAAPAVLTAPLGGLTATAAATVHTPVLAVLTAPLGALTGHMTATPPPLRARGNFARFEQPGPPLTPFDEEADFSFDHVVAFAKGWP